AQADLVRGLQPDVARDPVQGFGADAARAKEPAGLVDGRIAHLPGLRGLGPRRRRIGSFRRIGHGRMPSILVRGAAGRPLLGDSRYAPDIPGFPLGFCWNRSSPRRLTVPVPGSRLTVVLRPPSDLSAGAGARARIRAFLFVVLSILIALPLGCSGSGGKAGGAGPAPSSPPTSPAHRPLLI